MLSKGLLAASSLNTVIFRVTTTVSESLDGSLMVTGATFEATAITSSPFGARRITTVGLVVNGVI